MLGKRAFAHSGAGLREFFDWLRQLTGPDPTAVAVALESPRGAVVEALLESRYCTWSINPKQLDRFRDRFSMAGAKTTIAMPSCWPTRYAPTRCVSGA